MGKGANDRMKREFMPCDCFYCEEELTKKTITREHLVPHTYGGTDHPSNIVVACRDCNTRAGRKSLPEKFAMAKNERYKEYMVYMYGDIYTTQPIPDGDYDMTYEAPYEAFIKQTQDKGVFLVVPRETFEEYGSEATSPLSITVGHMFFLHDNPTQDDAGDANHFRAVYMGVNGRLPNETPLDTRTLVPEPKL